WAKSGLQRYHPEDAATASAPLGRFCGTTGRKCDRSQGACPSVGPSNLATSVTSSAASNGLLRQWSAPIAVAGAATSSDRAPVAPDIAPLFTAGVARRRWSIVWSPP